MLREEDIRIDLGRCQSPDGKFATFIRVIHLSTGIERQQIPLGNAKTYHVQRQFLEEIERELNDKGITQYIVQHPSKSAPLNPEP